MPFKPNTFTTHFNHISLTLINEVLISQPHDPAHKPLNIIGEKYLAIWDTGATHTVITKKVVEECNLKPSGFTSNYTAGGIVEVSTYLINIVLRNNVVFPNLRVTEGEIFGDSEVLIGMDIISRGDFAITNYEGKTTFTFRIPSMEKIDFVKQPYKQMPTHSESKIGRNEPCPCGS